MNERILILADEAINEVPGAWDVPDKFCEVFASLIVKECIDYCGENLSKTVGGALKIHFGVEQ